MQITDLENNVVTLTDLEASIKQADAFRNFKVGDDFSKRRQAYWEDMYHKLVALKATALGAGTAAANSSK